MITADLLKKSFPASGANFGMLAPLLADAAVRFGITIPVHVAAWLAQLAHESGEFTRLSESFAYKDPARLLKVFPRDFKSLEDAKAVHARGQHAIANRAYAFQNGNGNEASGDGWRYRGAGYIQTTGRGNFARTGAGIGIDLVANPDRLREPAVAALAAGFFWKDNNLGRFVDAGDFDGLCDAINLGRKTKAIGDAHGYADRLAKFTTLKKVMGL